MPTKTTPTTPTAPPKKPAQPPKDNLFRAVRPGVELRAHDTDQDAMPTLVGRFAVFNEWTEIDSVYEGRFMERFAPGAFKKTISENRERIRVLFQHGRDPQIGDKPLGPIETLREDASGVYYEVGLLDTQYNRELLPALERDLYGASFRFRVVKEHLDNDPPASRHNPDRLPERTVLEAQVLEFGPVTFPAYAGASAGVRSITDDYATASLRTPGPEAVPSGTSTTGAASVKPSEPPRHSTGSATHTTNQETSTVALTYEEMTARNEELRSLIDSINTEAGDEPLEDVRQAEFDSLTAEFDQNARAIEKIEDRRARAKKVAESTAGTSTESARFDVPQVRKTPSDPYDLRGLQFSDREDMGRQLQDRARRAIDQASYPDADKAKYQERAEWLVQNADTVDGQLSRRILATGSPIYQRAFMKTLVGQPLSDTEQRALSSGTGSEGGFAVPFTLDPTVILTSDGSVNPIRTIARVETVVGSNEWKGVSSAGVTASYVTEATEAGDNAPTLVQPTVKPVRAQAFIPFSVEADQDWTSLRSEMATLLQDSKDDLEAEKFITGTGTNEPEGVVAGLAASSEVETAAVTTFAVGDLYKLRSELPPRFRARASFIANLAQYQRVRQFDTSGGANLWVTLGGGEPERLLGHRAYEASDMADTVAASDKILVFGDFRHFLIVDRVGMSVEVVPHLFGANRRPTGQRGLYAHWRNSSVVLADGAFRVLKVKAA